MSSLADDVLAAVQTGLFRIRNMLATDRANDSSTKSARQQFRGRFDSMIEELVRSDHKAGVEQLSRFAEHYEQLVPVDPQRGTDAYLTQERIRIVCEALAAGLVASFERQLDLLTVAKRVDHRELGARLSELTQTGQESGDEAQAIRGELAGLARANENVMVLLRANDMAIAAMQKTHDRLQQTVPADMTREDLQDSVIAAFEREVAEAHTVAASVTESPADAQEGVVSC